MAQKKTYELWRNVFTSNSGVVLSTIIFSFFLNMLALTGSIFMLQVYDRVIPSGSVATLVALSVIVLALYVYYGVLDYLRGRVFVRVGKKVEESLRARVFDLMSFLSLTKQNQYGGQPVQDLAAIRQFISGQGPMAYFDMPYVPFYLAIIFMLHWVLGAFALLSAIVIVGCALLASRATRGPTGNAQTAAMKAAILTEESRRNVEAMYSLGMKRAIRNRWLGVQAEALEAQTEANDAGSGYSGFSRVFRMIVQSAMLGLAAWLVIRHEISSGSIIASSIIMGRALLPIETAVAGWSNLISARKAYERLAALLETLPPEPERTALPPPKGLVEVENVTVVPSGSDKPILHNVSFRVEPGRGLGIIGPTGAGKSTMARALVGLSPLRTGAVRIDGATPSQRDSDEHGRLIGYLPQDVQIFDGTVAENIARFSAKPDPSAIIGAAKLANIHEFIVRLPQGYDTPLSQGGSRLSAGQRQRLALARALFGDPVVLVLDEPNSNLDVDGEKALDAAMRACLARGASVIVVAHRPSALHAIDALLVLRNGQVAEYGKRDDVLKKLAGQAAPQAQPQPAAPAKTAAPAAAAPAEKKTVSTSLSIAGKMPLPGNQTRN